MNGMSSHPDLSARFRDEPRTDGIQTCTESMNLLIERWMLEGSGQSASLLDTNGLTALLLVLDGTLDCKDPDTGSTVRMATGDYIVVRGSDRSLDVTGQAIVIRCVFHGDVDQERFPETRRSDGGLIVSNAFADRPRIVTVCETRHVRFDIVTSQGHASPDGRECDSSSHEWLLILKGDTIFTIEGAEHPLKAGDAIYLPPRVPNGVRGTNVESGTVWLAVFYRGAIGPFDWQPRATPAETSSRASADGGTMSAAARRLNAFRELQG